MNPTVGQLVAAQYIHNLTVMHLSTKTKRIDFHTFFSPPIRLVNVMILAHFEEWWTSADLVLDPQKPMPICNERIFGSVSYRRTEDKPNPIVGLFYALKYSVQSPEVDPASRKELFQMVRLLIHRLEDTNMLTEGTQAWDEG